MAVDFRGHPMFAPGFNSPTRFEADVYDCEVWGKIPSDIEGTFYRVQCDFQYRPPMNEWPTGFNGDGHVSAFRFANGSVDFKARYVKTDRLMTERKARKRLWGVYRNPYTDDPSVANIDRGAANTHIYWHGGKMIVLKEDSLPYAIDPHSLETLGRWDFHGKWLRTLVNGQVRQDGNTDEMTWDMHYLVADLARTITLLPGDVLLSGTPANSRPVQPGDVVEVEAEGLGRLTNHVVEGPTPIRADVGAQPTESEEVLSTALGGDWEFRGIRPPRR